MERGRRGGGAKREEGVVKGRGMYTRPSFSQGGVTSCARIFKQSMEALGTE